MSPDRKTLKASYWMYATFIFINANPLSGFQDGLRRRLHRCLTDSDPNCLYLVEQ